LQPLREEPTLGTTAQEGFAQAEQMAENNGIPGTLSDMVNK